MPVIEEVRVADGELDNDGETDDVELAEAVPMGVLDVTGVNEDVKEFFAEFVTVDVAVWQPVELSDGLLEEFAEKDEATEDENSPEDVLEDDRDRWIEAVTEPEGVTESDGLDVPELLRLPVLESDPVGERDMDDVAEGVIVNKIEGETDNVDDTEVVADEVVVEVAVAEGETVSDVIGEGVDDVDELDVLEGLFTEELDTEADADIDDTPVCVPEKVLTPDSVSRELGVEDWDDDEENEASPVFETVGVRVTSAVLEDRKLGVAEKQTLAVPVRIDVVVNVPQSDEDRLKILVRETAAE